MCFVDAVPRDQQSSSHGVRRGGGRGRGVGDGAGGVANPEHPNTIEAGRVVNRERPQMIERRLNSGGDCGRGTDEHRGNRKPQPD